MSDEVDYADDATAPTRLGLAEYVVALRVGLSERFVALAVGVLLLSVICGSALLVFILATLP